MDAETFRRKMRQLLIVYVTANAVLVSVIVTVIELLTG